MKTTANKIFTRRQYLDGKCTHSEYYAQFVTPQIINITKQWVGEKEILNSQNEHFSDIHLSHWDSIAQPFRSVSSVFATFKVVKDVPTLSGMVCIAKEAARQIKAKHVTA